MSNGNIAQEFEAFRRRQGAPPIGIADEFEAFRQEQQCLTELPPIEELQRSFRAAREPVEQTEGVRFPAGAEIKRPPPIPRGRLGVVGTAYAPLVGLEPTPEEEAGLREAARAFREAGEQPIVPLTKLFPEGPPTATITGFKQPSKLAEARALVGEGPSPYETPEIPVGGIARGAAEFVEGLTTPLNIALLTSIGLTAGALPLVSRLVSGGFSLHMIRGVVQQNPELQEALNAGDEQRAAQVATRMGLTTVLAALTGKHAIRGRAAAGEVSRVRPAVERAAEAKPARVSEPLPPPQPIAPREAAELGVAPERVPEVLRRQREAEAVVAQAAQRRPRRPTPILEQRGIAEEFETFREARKAAPAPPRPEVLPGMEKAVREQAEAARRVEGEKLGEEFATPVEERAGKPIEAAPIFRGTEAAPQREMFGAERPAPAPPSALANLRDATTGRPFAAKLLQGSARTDIGSVYAEGAAAVPILGRGRYTTPVRKFAKFFGPKVQEVEVKLNNPLVITNDTQWRALTKRAGWEFPNPIRFDEAGKAKARKEISSLRAMLEREGHDGVVIRLSRVGDEAKTLRKVFGEDTTVEFAPPKAVLDEFGDPIERGGRVVDSMGRSGKVTSVGALVQDLETGKPVFREDMLKVDFGKGPEPVSIAEVTVGRHGRPKALEGIGRKPVRLFGESEEAFGARASRELGFETYGLEGKRPTLPSIERETQPPELIRRSEIIKEISTKLNIPVRVGRFRGKVIGIYKVRPEAIRTKLAQDIPVVAHEIGHHINKILWGSYTRKTGERLDWRPLTPYRAELKAIATKPRAGQSYLPEGFAEFIRMYLTNPAEAQARAPRFSNFFERELQGAADLRATLEQARTDIRRWVEQPAVAKVLSQISKQEAPRRGNALESLYTDFKDALLPIQRAVTGMAKGKRVPTEENAYELARLFAGWWGKAEHFLERGTFDPKTLKVTGKPLTEVLRPVEGNLDNFRAYLVARRAVEKGLQGKETGIELETARQAVQQLDSPTFQKAAQELYQYQNSLLGYLRDSGMLSQEQYTRIVALNRDYVPFYRLFEESPLGGGRGAGKKVFADLWTPVKRMKGSGREIVDPLESIVKNTYTYLNLAERNGVGQALVRQAERSEGAAQWIEEVSAPQRPAKFQLQEIERVLKKAGADLSGADLEATAMIFRPSTFTPTQEGIIAVFENGQRQFFQVQPDLYRALKGMDQESSNLVIRLLSMPARALRLGATALGPEFVIRNPLRDTMTAFMQSRHGFKPGVDTLRGVFHALKRDELYWEWKRTGGEHAALVSLDRTTLQQGVTDLLRSRVGWTVRHPIEALRIISSTSEAATRLGEFELARRAGETPRAAGLASREVSLDFARMGARSRAVNSIVAFWNAAVEGTDKFARVHIENPKGTLAKAVAGVTVPSLLLYAINRDDPVYQELPWWRKDFFWNIPTRGTLLETQTPFIPIPKPFLWGMVYASVPERVMEWVDKKDPAAFDDLLLSLGTATLPGMIPTAAIPIAEMWANRSIFTGKRLEPRYMEGVHPQHRAYPHTSEFSKKMAGVIWKLSIGNALKAINMEVSPIKLDQAIFSITGGLGRALVKAPDKLLRDKGAPEPPSGTLADIPMLRAFALRWPTGQAQSIQKFYDRLEDLETKVSTLRFEGRYPGRAPGAPKLTPQEDAELKRLRTANKRMRRLNQAIRAAYSSDDSPEQKRRQIDTYMLQMLEIAREVMGKPRIAPTSLGGEFERFRQEQRLTFHAP